MTDLTTIARPYAQSAFEYAKENKMLDEWQQVLATLSQFIVHTEVLSILKNPTYSAEQQADLCYVLVNKELDTPQQNFVKVLAENNRLVALPAIFELFVAFRAEAEKVLPVVVKSAQPLDQDDLKKINTFLAAKFAQGISLETEVDESLIGGVLIQAGNQVIDGSVRGQLEKLKRVAIS
jgi:F-type H+-transporting ATPase subunit delta